MNNSATTRTYHSFPKDTYGFIDENEIFVLVDGASKAIHSWSYRFDDQRMYITYVGNDDLYIYTDVPVAKAFSMLVTDSLGAFVAKHIKPEHAFVKRNR